MSLILVDESTFTSDKIHQLQYPLLIVIKRNLIICGLGNEICTARVNFLTHVDFIRVLILSAICIDYLLTPLAAHS
jgi:hypothetical protein